MVLIGNNLFTDLSRCIEMYSSNVKLYEVTLFNPLNVLENSFKY